LGPPGGPPGHLGSSRRPGKMFLRSFFWVEIFFDTYFFGSPGTPPPRVGYPRSPHGWVPAGPPRVLKKSLGGGSSFVHNGAEWPPICGMHTKVLGVARAEGRPLIPPSARSLRCPPAKVPISGLFDSSQPPPDLPGVRRCVSTCVRCEGMGSVSPPPSSPVTLPPPPLRALRVVRTRGAPFTDDEFAMAEIVPGTRVAPRRRGKHAPSSRGPPGACRCSRIGSLEVFCRSLKHFITL